MRDLVGKVAVITGAGSGFGLEFARAAVRHRMKLVLGDVQEDALDAAVREMRAAGAEAMGLRGDGSKAEGVKRLADRALASYAEAHVPRSRIGVSVLCPAFVPTGIRDSERNRPADLVDREPLTESQLMARKQSEKAVSSGRLTAAEVAQKTFQAVREDRFYVITHPRLLRSVELRLQDIVQQREPSDPFTYKPEVKPG